MRITVNDEPREVEAAELDRVLDELGYGEAAVATALNGQFVQASLRPGRPLAEGDRLEVLAPMQGG